MVCLMMKVNKLRHRVQIQSPTRNQNELGEVTEGWATASTVWASVEPLSGRELAKAQQVQADVTHRVIIRYRPGVKQDWRVVHMGRELNITVVRNIEERNEMIELLCIERAG